MSSTEPSTLLGLIQRGRGACFEAAHTQPAPARDHVVDCIVRDPRWDHQVEQRDWLYAALVAELGIEPARLRAAYAGPVDARANADLDGDAGAAAISLLADFAEPADGPRLCDLLKDALAQGNIYAQCDLVDGLARLGHVAAVGIIDEIFDGTVYSYLRTRCAAASALLSPDFAEYRAIECLDDCESETRALGVTHASDRMPMVRERIRGMAEDVTEEDCNRRTASARIAQWR